MSATPGAPRRATRDHAAPMLLAPHRLMPADPAARRVAWDLYEAVREAPIYSPHGHVDIGLFATDAPFGDPAELLVVPDHYVTRMLLSKASPPTASDFRAARQDDRRPREIWREFCANWHLFLGTPSRYWLAHEFAEVLGVTTHPSAETADELYDQISARLAEPEFRPRALLDRFGIELISTTDAATDDLAQHAKVAATLPGRVIPTFRPDASSPRVGQAGPGWRAAGALAEVDTSTYDGYLQAIRQRRRALCRGGRTGHGPRSSRPPAPLSDGTLAARIYASALKGEVSAEDAAAFAGHMLYQSAVMSARTAW